MKVRSLSSIDTSGAVLNVPQKVLAQRLSLLFAVVLFVLFSLDIINDIKSNKIIIDGFEARATNKKLQYLKRFAHLNLYYLVY